jgi:type IV secretion system protein VirB3
MVDDPVRSPIRVSLLRPMLLLGGERELVMASGMLTAILVFSLANMVCAILGFTFWAVALYVFGRMAKHDPVLMKVYIRHVNKRLYYPARPHVSAVDLEIKKHQ